MYTLITGACKGIGKAMAFECASRGMNLLLVSNDEACLMQVCAELTESRKITCQYFIADLTLDDAPAKIYRWIKQNRYAVNTLINNVGIGKGGTFGRMDLADFQYMMKLNNHAMVGLTYLLLDELQKHKRSYILNMSSLEATLPLPYKAVYTGTKTFVYAFSLALAQELKHGNTSVTVVCPGPVLTNADGLSRIQAHGARAKLVMMYPEQVARIAVSGMLRGKQVIVPGFLNTVFFMLGSFLPVAWKMPLLEKLFRVYKT